MNEASASKREGLSTHDVEEGDVFAPRFDGNGLIVCVTVEAGTGVVLMVAYMNAEALDASLRTGVATYWSRSRNRIWRKGDTSGQVQRIVEIRTDCDQDALLLGVEVGGDGGCCHTGRRSCFYRHVVTDPVSGSRLVELPLTAPKQADRPETITDGRDAAG